MSLGRWVPLLTAQLSHETLKTGLISLCHPLINNISGTMMRIR
jgi:hypothetical protein